jgi:hypothetical protein
VPATSDAMLAQRSLIYDELMTSAILLWYYQPLKQSPSVRHFVSGLRTIAKQDMTHLGGSASRKTITQLQKDQKNVDEHFWSTPTDYVHGMLLL